MGDVRSMLLFGLALCLGCSEQQILPIDPPDDDDSAATDDDDSSPDDDDATPPREPSLQIEPSSFGFGDRPIGCPAEVVLTLANVGEIELLVYELALVEAAETGELSLVDSPGAATLAPGESLQLTVLHAPSDQQPDAATLTVLSNDPQAPEQHATFTGGASPGETGADAYLQENNRAVDVLWIIDNSCSMASEQEALGDNFGSFLEIVDSLELDYQVGVVSTDADDDGLLQGSPAVVTPATADREAVFADNVALGQLGSGTEQGLDMALAALVEHAAPGGPNDGFVRPGAGLRLIFVSDEDDYSWDLASPQDYVDAFTALKPNPANVIASDITGGELGCVAPGANADPALRYLEVTQATGGLSTTICAPGWIDTLTQLAWLADSYADSFQLSAPAVPATVVVTVGGVPTTTGWSFDAALNAVIFEPDSVPPNGALVEVDYALVQECWD